MPGTWQGTEVRRPAVAGQFYPADAAQLRTAVSQLLAHARSTDGTLPKALIAPHAGYIYSGDVAATAFATLKEHAEQIKRVILIGPAHYVAVRGIAIPTTAAFATPLGQVPVDHDVLEKIDARPWVVRTDGPHIPEHALEVELPFLQSVLGDFRLVPLVVGDAEPEEVADVLSALWGEAETLIVVSSDLSHYHDYDTAQRRDHATAELIERGDWAAIGPNQACGFLAVAGLLSEALRRGLTTRRLSLCNSGDTAGSRARVVGYGAWRFDPVA